jgi:hypothetical protein
VIIAVGAGIIYPALRIAGITARPMRTPSPDQSLEAIGILNQMMESWSVDRLKIYSIRQDRYALVPQQTTYFIGPTGDFIAPRPIEIVGANIVLTNQFPELHFPMHVYDDVEWLKITIPELQGGIWPRTLYNDRAYPDSKLYLYPYPTVANDLELYTFSELQDTFALVTDAANCPPGYARAMKYNLALELAAAYPKESNLLPGAIELAAQALAMIESRNAPIPKLVNDAASLGHGARGESRWWLTGGF